MSNKRNFETDILFRFRCDREDPQDLSALERREEKELDIIDIYFIRQVSWLGLQVQLCGMSFH